MILLDIIADLKNKIVTGDTGIEIKGIAYDSRSVRQEYLFVCISGFKTDGHDYINQAVENGASAIVVEKDVFVPEGVTVVKVDDTRDALALVSRAFFGYPAQNIKLIGVTGTNGKTTTTYMIKSILERKGFKTALLGTIANIIDGKKVEASRTTPESCDMQQMFSLMRDCKTEYCVMEVSSHSLELKRVAGCQFEVGVFTNLTRDHLDFHITFENYFNAKLKLFKQSNMAVINIDDEYGRKMLEKVEIPCLTYSEKTEADIRADDVEIAAGYTSFILKHGKESVSIRLRMPGRFNVYNALSAAGVCLSQGISLEDIKLGLEGMKGVPGRSEVIQSKDGFTVIIDYAHTPDGLVNILNTVREYAKARIITVFGCGGDRDKTKRPIMGEVVGKLSTYSIVTSDNPRTEDPVSIINDILPGIKGTGARFEVVVNRREAIEKALSIAQKDDVVVIAGKGHETYQILGTAKIHFDEREIVNEILNASL